MRSSTDSSPIESLTKSAPGRGAAPGGTDAWDMKCGSEIDDAIPPKLTAVVKRRVVSTTRFAVSADVARNVIRTPGPRAWLACVACPA